MKGINDRWSLEDVHMVCCIMTLQESLLFIDAPTYAQAGLTL
jgi:hypothetical protein